MIKKFKYISSSYIINVDNLNYDKNETKFIKLLVILILLNM